MSRRWGRWWRHRSLTFRLTIVATVVLALGLVTGAAGLATLFYHSRIDAVDADVRAQSATVTALVASGQVPQPLPSPAGQSVLSQVVGTDGTVIAATASASAVVPMLPVRVLTASDSGQPFTTTASSMGSDPLRASVASTRLHGRPVLVVTAVPFTDVGEILSALLRILLIAVPVILLAAAIATWLAVSSALRPVDQLRSAADEVAQTSGRVAERLPVPDSGDELARLAETLNAMLERLVTATEQQRMFLADAAHELRSPVAAIRAQLEVALATPTTLEEWPIVASDVLEDVARVADLADDMLLLARLDSGSTSRREVVDVRELLDLEGPPLLVEADPGALRRAIDNLVSNAHRHATTVRTDAFADAGEVVIIVDDDGPGVDPDDRERVFERWVRLDDARTRDAGGAGLGLAIVRSVARSSGGEAALEESPLGGARATLRFPVASGTLG